MDVHTHRYRTPSKVNKSKGLVHKERTKYCGEEEEEKMKKIIFHI
jgi:hypothetical protein